MERWDKDAGPSVELRRWFHHDIEHNNAVALREILQGKLGGAPRLSSDSPGEPSMEGVP